MTLIGTPANILATSIVAEHGLPTFSFFDFTPIGLVVFATGIVYMVLIGRRLLPVRTSPGDQATERQLQGLHQRGARPAGEACWPANPCSSPD